MATTKTVTVFNEDQLKVSIMQNHTTINIGANIYLNSTVRVHDVHDVVVNGFGYEVNGNDLVQCFNITGSSIGIHDLQIDSCSNMVHVHYNNRSLPPPPPLPHLF